MADTSAEAAIKTLEEGRFYEDYDDSMAMLGSLRLLKRERDQALARERALLDSNQEARDFLKERDQLRREVHRMKTLISEIAAAQLWTEDPDACEPNGGITRDFQEAREEEAEDWIIKARELLEFAPAPRQTGQEGV